MVLRSKPCIASNCLHVPSYRRAGACWLNARFPQVAAGTGPVGAVKRRSSRRDETTFGCRLQLVAVRFLK